MDTNTTGLMSRFAGQFLDSSRAFCTDLGRLLKQIAADRHSLIWLLLISVVGTAVRIWFLDQPMRYDEAHTYMTFVEPGVDRLFYYQEPNNHVGHTLLVYVSTSLFGDEPWAIRLPTFLAGILAVPMTYLCARTVFRRSLGLVAAGLVAASPILVLYSTNARGYSGIVLTTMVLIPLNLYLVRKESAFAGFLVADLMAIGLYTIPIMVFPIAMLVVWSILLAYHSGGWSKTLRVLRSLVLVLLLCGIVTLLLYTPVILTSGLSRLVANNTISPRALSESVALWPQLAQRVWMQYFADLPVLVRLFLGVCLFAGSVYLWKVNRPAFLLVPASLIGIGLMLFATRTLPFVRTWTFLLPLGFCLVDAAITAVVRLFAVPIRVTAAGALGLLFAVGISYNLTALNVVPRYPETGPAPDAEAIVQYLEPRLNEGDWVLVRRFWPFRYYGHHLGMPLGSFAKVGQGDGDIYVVVQLPGSTFEKVVRKNYPELDKEDYAIQEFPSTLLYVPKGAAD
jgi:4-amino-4-deoxy-L-arabinose transferase-like glycosyltransferase